MIVFIVTYLHKYTIHDYLSTWGTSQKARIKVLYYEDLFWLHSLPQATYIFTDLERLSPLQRQQAETIARCLAEKGFPVLNRPQAVLLRYDLLTMLYSAGVNDFRAFRLRDVDESLRYPVFLRCENDHDGPVSGLIQDARELQVAVLDAVYRGAAPLHMLAVEFRDTADDSGLYRKYSAFLIGNRFVPRHLFFSEKWMTKFAERVGQPEIAEEWRYVFEEPNPHEEQIRDIFQRAAIDYGRIDYAVLNGQVIVWEINTNPTIATPSARIDPARIPALREVSARLRAAFEEVCETPSASLGESLSITPALRDELGATERASWKILLRQRSRPARLWLRDIPVNLRRAFTS